MEIPESIKKLFQEMIVPELGKIHEENQKIVAILEITNKRLDDVNQHLADQSRRIDEVRTELSARIDEVRTELTGRIDDTNNRIDDTNKRIANVRSELSREVKDVHSELSREIKDVRSELSEKMEKMHSDLVSRLDANNGRIDQFFMTAATKEAQAGMDRRLMHLEQEVGHLKQQVAA